MRYLILATAILSLACGHTDRSAPPALAAETKSAATTPSLLSEARAMVEQRYAQHFAGGQGFSLDTLRGRRAWFTPRLYDLMLADMGHPEEGIGYIEADPFVDGQEDAKQFAVHAARQSHDTVFVDVDVTYRRTWGTDTRRVGSRSPLFRPLRDGRLPTCGMRMVAWRKGWSRLPDRNSGDGRRDESGFGAGRARLVRRRTLDAVGWSYIAERLLPYLERRTQWAF